MTELETVSIAKPLQNRQHAQIPCLGQIWHATIRHRNAYRLNLDWCIVLPTHGQNQRNITFSTKFSIF